jgi:hypothetical protein
VYTSKPTLELNRTVDVDVDVDADVVCFMCLSMLHTATENVSRYVCLERQAKDKPDEKQSGIQNVFATL